MNTEKARFIKIKNVLVLTLALNWLVSAAKILYGLFTNCASMSADGLHSLSDGASNIIGLVGIWAASRPVDRDHPYGHKKYETFSSLGIAMFLVVLAAYILHNAYGRFFNPVMPDVNAASFVVMIVTLAVNIFVMRYEMGKSKELKSDILYSDAMHTKSDILVSISVIATLVSIRIGFPVIDTIVAVVIAGFIGHAAFEIFKNSSNVLCDKAPLMADGIKDIVIKIEGVKECHMIRARGREDDIHVDLHVVVNPNMHVSKAHNISEAIEKEIKQKTQGVTDVVVHIEPR